MTGAGAAFFDLDHVLIPGSSLFLLARDLRAHDVFNPRDLLVIASRRSKSVTGKETQRYKKSLQQRTLAAVVGQQQAEVSGWIQQLAAYEILPRVYPDMARIIAAHRAAGDRTYLVTAAPDELAVAVANELEMDAAVGSVAEVDADGRFTGRRVALPLVGESRRAAVLSIIERDGLDAARCHVYSRAVDDKELMKDVGFAHAVNPETKLLRTAERRGWAVHEMRPIRRKIRVGYPIPVRFGLLVAAGYALARVRSWLK